jgi:hypothetical protein
MNYYLSNKKLNFHLIFLFILSLYYLIPQILFGQFIIKSHDLLDSEVVYNHIIGKIYRGEFESISFFLGGEIKWYFLRRIFQPLTLLYAFFNTEIAYWLTDIIIKTACYICLFKLSRKLKCTLFNSCLIACLFACSIDAWTHFGLGIATFPYLIYLLIKNKNLQIKHYFILSFIGLNTDLANEVLIIPMLFFVYLIMCSNLQKYNFKLFIKISSILYLFIFLSNSNLIYAQLFEGPFHREAFFYESVDFNSNLINLFKNFFSIPNFNEAYFFHMLPYTFFIFPIVLVSLFSKSKKIYLLLIIIFLTLFINFVLDLESIVSLKNNSQGLLKTIHWGYMKRLLPVLYGLLFILISKSDIIKKIKYLIYPLLFLSLITFQVRISAVPITKQLINFENLNIEQKKNLRDYFHGRKYVLLFKEINKISKIKKKGTNNNFKSLYTFKGYYDYENYKFIKSLVNKSRTISIGLDPMVAVVNNIKVIDGYHNLYPLSYKLKFRKVIKEQLNYYPDYKNYYDNWGQRIYTFVTDSNVININFNEARALGADYVISKYSILNEKLELICEKCNDSPELFLYKIKI